MHQMTYKCPVPNCGGTLKIERETMNQIAVLCINGHRFEKGAGLPKAHEKSLKSSGKWRDKSSSGSTYRFNARAGYKHPNPQKGQPMYTLEPRRF